MKKVNILSYEDCDNEIFIKYYKGNNKFDMIVTTYINGMKLEFFPYDEVDYFIGDYECSEEDVMHDIFSKYLSNLLWRVEISDEIIDILGREGMIESIDRMIERDYIIDRDE